HVEHAVSLIKDEDFYLFQNDLHTVFASHSRVILKNQVLYIQFDYGVKFLCLFLRNLYRYFITL
ncbi:MAG: hypothetical protein P8Y04_03190, partial [Desulfobulbaceae bacterium]